MAQCYVEGASTRWVDDIAKATGVDGISKSQVSRIRGGLDEFVAARRDWPLNAGAYAFVWIDALALRVREHGGVATAPLLGRPASATIAMILAAG